MINFIKQIAELFARAFLGTLAGLANGFVNFEKYIEPLLQIEQYLVTGLAIIAMITSLMLVIFNFASGHGKKHR